MTAYARMILGLALTVFPMPLAPSGAAQRPDQTASPSHLSIPVTLTLRVADGRRQFRPGEIIPIELEFNSSIPKRFVVDGATYDRSGRLTIDDFTIEPEDAVTDPMLDYFASSGGYIGGGLRGMGVLGDKPFTVKLQLNEWFRFDKAGTYRLTVRSGRVTDDAQTAATTRSVLPVESNTVSFEVLPRDRDWEATALTDALKILDAQVPDVDRRQGCRILRFLATDAAVDEMIKRYDGQWGCEFEYMAGLFGAPNRNRVVRQLEAGLQANDQPVTQGYLRTLAVLSVYAQHPEFRPVQTHDTKARIIPPGELSRRPELIQVAEAEYVDILSMALLQKTKRARAVTLAGRLESSQGRYSTSPSGSDPSRDHLRDQLAATFLELPVERQISLLQYQWGSLGPAMLPILRGLVASSPSASPSLADLALRRLHELAPEEGRTLILREIRNPPPGASLKTLGRLPDRELPELDDILAANVEESVETSQGFEEVAIRAELLHRYASPAVAARVLARIGDRLTPMACRPQSAILAYFLRADAETGKTLLDRALTSRAITGCYKSALRDVAKLHMTPVVEAAALAHLDDPDAQVVVSAAETLRHHGSPASLQPLRAQFERWHVAWEGHQEELRYSHAQDRPDAMQGMVELTFLQALGQGQGWLTDKRGLSELRALCVTDNCRTQADHLVNSTDDTRITILRVEDPDDSLVMLAQYQFTSIAALEQKLTQYPQGASFTLDVSSLDPQVARATVTEILRFARAQGIRIRP